MRSGSGAIGSDLDLAKKMVLFERELSQMGKEHKQEIHDFRQALKDTDMTVKNLRHQVEQSQASNEFKSQEIAANQTDVLQNIQMRLD